MILDIAYTQHQGTDWRYPVQQDALWNSVEVLQSRNLHPAGLQTQADVVSLAVAGNAQAVVTHNVRDLARGELAWPHLRILTPAQFLQEQP